MMKNRTDKTLTMRGKSVSIFKPSEKQIKKEELYAH
jgi:hypothetical protein